MTDEPVVISVEEAAKLLGIGRNTAYAGVKSGEIPSIKIGKRFRIPKAALNNLLEVKPEPEIVELGHEPEQILKVPRRRPERSVQIFITVSVTLNNQLARAAIDHGNSMSGEIVDRLKASFADGEKK